MALVVPGRNAKAKAVMGSISDDRPLVSGPSCRILQSARGAQRPISFATTSASPCHRKLAAVCRTATRELLVFYECMQLAGTTAKNGLFTYWNSSDGPSEDRFGWWTARSAYPPKEIATMGNFTQRADQIRSPLEDTLASALLPVIRNPLLLQPLHLSKTPSSMPTPVTLAHRCAGVPNG